MSVKPYVERALFIIGDQNRGKSTQLRSMFLDRRLGEYGKIPTKRNVRNSYSLSNERWLYLRLTSPHEVGEELEEFLEKCSDEMQKHPTARRWNFAGPLQPTATPKLDDGPMVIAAFVKRFNPERVRAVILSPDRFGSYLPKASHKRLVANLYATSRVEVITMDATTRDRNGLTYADFFDFT